MTGPLFIAEVSSNHHRDPDRCRAFIDAAADMGCGAVKFQLFRVDQLFSPEVLVESRSARDRAAWELPESMIPELAAHCRSKNIQLGCTPFYLDAVPVLAPHVDFLKIASYELTWPALLEACAATQLPLILSTGMADLAEVVAAVDIIRRAGGSQLTLLHCSSAYPTPPAEANLAAIETLRRETGCAVGWSDHTRNAGVIHRAVSRWGAAVVEFHLDLEGEGAEFGSGHCWLPDEIGPVISAVNDGFLADGAAQKAPNSKEGRERMWRADPEDGLRPFKAIRDDLQLKD